MRAVRTLAAVVALALTATACALPPMVEQRPTLANLQTLRAKEIPGLAVGDFRLAQGLPARMDHAITIRASSLKAPGAGSFSGYLKQTLETELKGAGKLDAAAASTVRGELTQSQVSTGLPDSRGALAARFTVIRDGKTVYERELVVDKSWSSSFIGAIAIPEAMDRYTALYPDLVNALLTDPAFRAAVQ